ncbi:MAG: DUF2939 domain-containing protein [Caulobacteraceae bacterium]|nr:DUF2939 domain-containing protein [Caulobacter sp.]RYF90772.1 MAG: DUF2939 domain-containing protein [Caulobacteraceae bacterium]
MRNSLFRIVLLALALFAIAFVAAPFYSYRALRAAAVAEDVQAMSQLVDFPAVRKSLAGQLDPDTTRTAEPPTIWQDPVGAIRRAWKDVAPQPPKIDRYVTVSGLGDVLRGYPPGEAPPEAKPDGSLMSGAKGLVSGPWPGVAYFGLERVRFAIKRPGEPDKVTLLTFERRSLFIWKLSHVQLPEGER